MELSCNVASLISRTRRTTSRRLPSSETSFLSLISDGQAGQSFLTCVSSSPRRQQPVIIFYIPQHRYTSRESFLHSMMRCSFVAVRGGQTPKRPKTSVQQATAACKCICIQREYFCTFSHLTMFCRISQVTNGGPAIRRCQYLMSFILTAKMYPTLFHRERGWSLTPLLSSFPLDVSNFAWARLQ